VLYGLALPAFGVIAVAVGDRPRRRLALALWAVIAVMGLFISLTGGGVIRPLIDSPAEAGVPIACAFTALAGIAVGSLRTGPARRGLGPRLVFMTGLASALFLAAAGLVPAAAAGEWRPGASLAPGRSHALESVRSVLQAEASGGRDFRVLWVGHLWGASENPVSTRPVDDRMLTGPEAGTLGDLFAPPSGPGERQLDRVIASIEQGATDRGGALLGTFNIAYVVLEREPGVSRWLAQRDLGVIRAEADYLLLENWASLDRAAVYNVLPAFVKALRDGDASATADDPLVERQALVSRSPSRLAAGDITGPGVVYVATQRDARWRAEVGDRRLEPVEGLWANAFRLPQGASGDLEVTYPLSWARLGLLAAVLLAWIVVVGAAFSAGTPPRTAPGVRR
jgi:hypothetical protein